MTRAEWYALASVLATIGGFGMLMLALTVERYSTSLATWGGGLAGMGFFGMISYVNR